MRLIDADAITRSIDINWGCDECKAQCVDNCLIHQLKEIVMTAPTISQWVPVSERLPEFRKQVLCCNEDGRVFTSCLTKIHIYFGGVFGKHYGVIAWMPLPEPYKESESE